MTIDTWFGIAKSIVHAKKGWVEIQDCFRTHLANAGSRTLLLLLFWHYTMRLSTLHLDDTGCVLLTLSVQLVSVCLEDLASFCNKEESLLDCSEAAYEQSLQQGPKHHLHLALTIPT